MNYDYFYIMRLRGRGPIKEKLVHEKNWNFLDKDANSETFENVWNWKKISFKSRQKNPCLLIDKFVIGEPLKQNPRSNILGLGSNRKTVVNC